MHLLGLSLVTGFSISTCIANVYIWKLFQEKRQRALTLHLLFLSFPKWIIAGGITLILSGMSMMYLTQGVFAGQIWFQIKMFLVILLILSDILLARPLGKSLSHFLSKEEESPQLLREAISLRRKYKAYYFVAISLLFLIYMMASFRFT